MNAEKHRKTKFTSLLETPHGHAFKNMAYASHMYEAAFQR